MKSLKPTTFTFIAFAWMSPVVQAAGDQMGGSHAMPQMAGQMPSMPLSEGEIRKVDKSAGKVTIKHGPLANLDMPPMTMVFRVKDAAWLDKMKPGAKIRFHAESINGALTVTQYEPMN